jgi:hypothetical protein
MNNKILFILVLILLSISSKVSAVDKCSTNGYSVITINGIFTDLNGAKTNAYALMRKLPPAYNNEPVKVDYLYNPTHLAGAGDIIDVIKQGFFDQKSDYDLEEMLNDASAKITTEKVLLIGHSQGNFYANNFYDKVANKEGGVPAESIGVYGVATPVDRVAGNGKYLTSDTDKVIAAVVGRVKNIMTPNAHIDLQKTDGDGHDFSNIYLKYKTDKIVSDIKSSFDKLKTNNIQNKLSSCISPQKISLAHKLNGVVINTSDFVVNSGINVLSYAYNGITGIAKSIGNTFANIAGRGLAAVGLAGNQEENNGGQLIFNDDAASEVNKNTIDNPQIDSSIENTNINPQIPNIGSATDSNAADIIISSGGQNNGGSNNGSGWDSSGNNGSGEPINTSEGSTLDTTKPVLTLVGEDNLTINLNEGYEDAGATALDDVDGVITTVMTGTVDNSKVGTYILTYTATDKAMNVGTVTRTVNVVNKIVEPVIPIPSITSTLSFPNTGDYALDGLDPNRGRKNLTSFIFQVVYTDSNNNPPQNIKLHVKDTKTAVLLPEIELTKITKGTDILSDGDFKNGELYIANNTFDEGEYSYSFAGNDKDGNTVKIDENDNLRFTSIPSNYTYQPKYSFGRNNGDGNDWQVWAFNGSNIYDWTDTYVNNYLHEQFKIQTYTGGYWCSQCIQRGIFNHDPQKGFEEADVSTSGLENNPQNNMNGLIYNVVIEWDSTGYKYTISHDSTVDATGHTNVPNMNNNLWVGWDGSFNNFKTFPSGDWYGVPYSSPMERTGGGSMILKPYRVYDPLAIQTPESKPVLSSEKIITSFNFESLVPVVSGVIKETEHTVLLTVPYGTEVSELAPTIFISEKSSIAPDNNMTQDFTAPVTYIVKAEDGTTSSYIVTVNISQNSNPIIEPEVPNDTPPTIASYTFNGTQGNITTNPLISNSAIILKSNKNVSWMSIKIEKEDNSGIYKSFRAGVGCVNGTSSCTKIWDGLLSKGGLLQAGNYKIKVHIKDDLNQEYENYLPSVISVSL